LLAKVGEIVSGQLRQNSRIKCSKPERIGRNEQAEEMADDDSRRARGMDKQQEGDSEEVSRKARNKS
jgi:hypothetical protein